MSMHITNPTGTYLPGKDDNFYSFIGDNANAVDYKYTLKLVINNVVKDIFMYSSLGAEPIKINIRNLLFPYLSIPTMSKQTTLQEYYGCIKVQLKVSGTNGTYSDSEVTSTAKFYWNGTSYDFWRAKWNYDQMDNFIPTSSQRALWVGPQRTSKSTLPYTGSGANRRITNTAISEAYPISQYTNGTATVVPFSQGLPGAQEIMWADRLFIYVYDACGKITKELMTILSEPRVSDFTVKFMTIPVGVPQINSLINSFIIERYGTEYTDTINPDNEKYYEILVSNSNTGQSTAPLTFEICKVENSTGVFDISNASLLYYSKLGGWWQLPLNCRNIRDTAIKSSIINKNITNTGNSEYSRLKDVVHTESTDVITANSGWVNKKLIPEYEDMIQSPEIWITHGDWYLPVVLQDATFRTDETNIRELVNYELKFTTGYDKKTII